MSKVTNADGAKLSEAAIQNTLDGIEIINQHQMKIGGVSVKFTFGRIIPKQMPSQSGKEV